MTNSVRHKNKAVKKIIVFFPLRHFFLHITLQQSCELIASMLQPTTSCAFDQSEPESKFRSWCKKGWRLDGRYFSFPPPLFFQNNRRHTHDTFINLQKKHSSVLSLLIFSFFIWLFFRQESACYHPIISSFGKRLKKRKKKNP